LSDVKIMNGPFRNPNEYERCKTHFCLRHNEMFSNELEEDWSSKEKVKDCNSTKLFTKN